MRLLTVSSEGAKFYRLVEETAEPGSRGGKASTPTTTISLVADASLPSFPHAKLGKYAPYHGRLAVIADPLGLHVIDCAGTGKELRLIPRASSINALSFSPRDSYIVTCEKFTQG